jgi:hypothetical protein
MIITVAVSGTALLLASSVRPATAAEHSHARKAHHAHAMSNRAWCANASIAIPPLAATSEAAYYSGGWSAPAGH